MTGNYANASGTVNDRIGQAPLTVTAAGVSKMYDGTTTATVVLSDNRVLGDNLTDSYTQASFTSTGPGTSLPVSVGGIAVSGPDAGNYALQNSTANTTASVYQSVAVIDDGDAARTTSGTWTNYAGQGYANDVDQATPVTSGNGAATATWTFTDLDPSQCYKVETTWTRNANRATNAPYTIGGGPSTLTLPVTVNQQQSPVGVSTSNQLEAPRPGRSWASTSRPRVRWRSRFPIAGANGNVIADAVRIEPVPANGPAIMVQAGTGCATDPVVLSTLSGSVQTTVSFGTVAGGSVVQKTFTVSNGGGGALSLSGLSAPAGYTVVCGGFCTTMVTVPPGGSTQFVLQENTSAAGALGGTVTFTTTDGSRESVQFPGDGDGDRRGADGCDLEYRAGRPGEPGDGQSWQPPRSAERGHVPLQFRVHRGLAIHELCGGGYGLFGPVHLRRRRHVHGVGPDHRPERIVYGLLHDGDGRQPADVDHRRRGSRSRFYDDGNVDELYRSRL